MAETKDAKRYIDANVLNKITRLELKARLIVEGFIAGMHKSPYRGFSVEFAAHREYTHGDEIKHLDWKVFGKTDRLMIKEYELETNVRCHILLDTSESMDYGSGELTKLELGAFIAASMSYLLTRQQDSVGIDCFDKSVHSRVPAMTGTGHMRQILQALATSKGQDKTDIMPVFHSLAEKYTARSMVMVISDLFDDPDKVLKALSFFRAKAHDVILFHVWDEFELTFPFKRMTKFEGLEEMPKVLCDPLAIRKAYLKEVEEFNEKIRRGCSGMMVDYTMISTDRKLDVELTKFLAARMGTRLVRRGAG